jgi:5-methyltetrahydrofolate--homocysteine methyltransferase
MISARAMQAGLYVLEPIMKNSKKVLKPKVVIGTVAGDLHDIGKKLVILALQNAGMEVIDLGIDVPPDAFVTAIKEHKPDVLGMSALLTMTMPMLKETIDALESYNIKSETKIIVGGSPVTYDYAMNIGADGYANDAYEVIDVIKNIM